MRTRTHRRCEHPILARTSASGHNAKDNMRISGNTFLVTGGGSGLGAACVRRLAAAGGNVVIADVNDEPGERFVHTDVTNPTDVEAAVRLTVDRPGGLRGCINCAGIAAGARVVGREGPHDLETFRRVIDVNLIGTFNVMRLAAAAMIENEPNEAGERGVIINAASIAAFEGQIGQAAYSASKGGVAALTLPAAREMAQHGIRVVAIAPGVFSTPMVEDLPEKARDSLISHTMFPDRAGDPSEFAAFAEHILTNAMLNGSVLRLDGAVRLAAR